MCDATITLDFSLISIWMGSGEHVVICRTYGEQMKFEDEWTTVFKFFVICFLRSKCCFVEIHGILIRRKSNCIWAIPWNIWIHLNLWTISAYFWYEYHWNCIAFISQEHNKTRKNFMEFDKNLFLINNSHQYEKTTMRLSSVLISISYIILHIIKCAHF